jgi:hypothetical protein
MLVPFTDEVAVLVMPVLDVEVELLATAVLANSDNRPNGPCRILIPR